MIAIPNTPGKYISFWKTLAAKNRDIAHTDETKQFVLISKAFDPFNPKWDLSEFEDGKTSKIRMLFSEGNFCMALVNCDFECRPVPGVKTDKTLQGAFLILTKIKPGDLDERDAAFDRTFLIGEQLINWLSEYMNLNRGQFSNFKYGTEHVINGSIVGTAYVFDYGIRAPGCFESDNFNGFTPQTS